MSDQIHTFSAAKENFPPRPSSTAALGHNLVDNRRLLPPSLGLPKAEATRFCRRPAAGPAVGNASAVRDALEGLMEIDIIVPVWDKAEGSGANATYRVAAFALVRIVDFRLPGENRISVQFLGFVSCG